MTLKINDPHGGANFENTHICFSCEAARLPEFDYGGGEINIAVLSVIFHQRLLTVAAACLCGRVDFKHMWKQL